VIEISPDENPDWHWDYVHGRVCYEKDELPIEKNDESKDLLQVGI
jgi:hypothetical protein